jgi:hypothetical protein
MSSSENEVSGEEQGAQANVSVYDFLYHDVRRIGSFLAQFDEAGHLQKITQSEGIVRSQSRGFRIAAGGNIPLVGSANLDVSRTPASGGSEASERIYDPLWANARTFLDYLAERDMLHRELSAARIGQFVLVSGELAILDLPMLRQLWELPIVRATVLSGAGRAEGSQTNAPNRAERRRESRPQQKREATIAEAPADFMLQTVKYLPHAIQAVLTNKDRTTAIWCSIGEESLVGSSADLMLKHGAIISGTWNLVGILDALPEVGGSAESVAAALGNTPLAQAAQSLAPFVRQMMGRPPHAYGLTPLLIFREISV